jgi:hypothetical protein
VSLQPVNSDLAAAENCTNVFSIALVLVALQILDGILTLSGMITFGLSAEGNPILRQLMHSIGLVPALILTKLGCIALIVVLCLQASRIYWLPRALTAVAGVYAIGAVLPWSFILLSEYLG